MVETLTISVLEEALKMFSEKIAKKLAEGKRITDTEVIILLLDQMNKRMDIMNESLNRRIDELRESMNKRIDDTNKRIDELREDLRLLHQEVSSIKSDVINILKEKIEKG